MKRGSKGMFGSLLWLLYFQMASSRPRDPFDLEPIANDSFQDLQGTPSTLQPGTSQTKQTIEVLNMPEGVTILTTQVPYNFFESGSRHKELPPAIRDYDKQTVDLKILPMIDGGEKNDSSLMPVGAPDVNDENQASENWKIPIEEIIPSTISTTSDFTNTEGLSSVENIFRNTYSYEETPPFDPNIEDITDIFYDITVNNEKSKENGPITAMEGSGFGETIDESVQLKEETFEAEGSGEYDRYEDTSRVPDEKSKTINNEEFLKNFNDVPPNESSKRKGKTGFIIDSLPQEDINNTQKSLTENNESENSNTEENTTKVMLNKEKSVIEDLQIIRPNDISTPDFDAYESLSFVTEENEHTSTEKVASTTDSDEINVKDDLVSSSEDNNFDITTEETIKTTEAINTEKILKHIENEESSFGATKIPETQEPSDEMQKLSKSIPTVNSTLEKIPQEVSINEEIVKDGQSNIAIIEDLENPETTTQNSKEANMLIVVEEPATMQNKIQENVRELTKDERTDKKSTFLSEKTEEVTQEMKPNNVNNNEGILNISTIGNEDPKITKKLTFLKDLTQESQIVTVTKPQHGEIIEETTEGNPLYEGLSTSAKENVTVNSIEENFTSLNSKVDLGFEITTEKTVLKQNNEDITERSLEIIIPTQENPVFDNNEEIIDETSIATAKLDELLEENEEIKQKVEENSFIFNVTTEHVEEIPSVTEINVQEEQKGLESISESPNDVEQEEGVTSTVNSLITEELYVEIENTSPENMSTSNDPKFLVEEIKNDLEEIPKMNHINDQTVGGFENNITLTEINNKKDISSEEDTNGNNAESTNIVESISNEKKLNKEETANNVNKIDQFHLQDEIKTDIRDKVTPNVTPFVEINTKSSATEDDWLKIINSSPKDETKYEEKMLDLLDEIIFYETTTSSNHNGSNGTNKTENINTTIDPFEETTKGSAEDDLFSVITQKVAVNGKFDSKNINLIGDEDGLDSKDKIDDNVEEILKSTTENFVVNYVQETTQASPSISSIVETTELEEMSNIKIDEEKTTSKFITSLKTKQSGPLVADQSKGGDVERYLLKMWPNLKQKEMKVLKSLTKEIDISTLAKYNLKYLLNAEIRPEDSLENINDKDEDSTKTFGHAFLRADEIDENVEICFVGSIGYQFVVKMNERVESPRYLDEFNKICIRSYEPILIVQEESSFLEFRFKVLHDVIILENVHINIHGKAEINEVFVKNLTAFNALIGSPIVVHHLNLENIYKPSGLTLKLFDVNVTTEMYINGRLIAENNDGYTENGMTTIIISTSVGVFCVFFFVIFVLVYQFCLKNKSRKMIYILTHR